MALLEWLFDLQLHSLDLRVLILLLFLGAGVFFVGTFMVMFPGF